MTSKSTTWKKIRSGLPAFVGVIGSFIFIASLYLMWIGMTTVAMVLIGLIISLVLLTVGVAIWEERTKSYALLKKRELSRIKECPNCDFSSKQDFVYCPKCGTELTTRYVEMGGFGAERVYK